MGRPHLRKKTLDIETKGSDLDEAYDGETKEEEVELMEKKRKNIIHGGLSSKKRKIKEGDYEMETDIDEESMEEKGKNIKGKIIVKGTVGRRISTRNKKKKIERGIK